MFRKKERMPERALTCKAARFCNNREPESDLCRKATTCFAGQLSCGKMLRHICCVNLFSLVTARRVLEISSYL